MDPRTKIKWSEALIEGEEVVAHWLSSKYGTNEIPFNYKNFKKNIFKMGIMQLADSPDPSRELGTELIEWVDIRRDKSPEGDEASKLIMASLLGKDIFARPFFNALIEESTLFGPSSIYEVCHDFSAAKTEQFKSIFDYLPEWVYTMEYYDSNEELMHSATVYPANIKIQEQQGVKTKITRDEFALHTFSNLCWSMKTPLDKLEAIAREHNWQSKKI
ncbi:MULTISPECIES: hypothetical protein [Pseudoalteromonas]|uniref:Uncharacterized protein n=1 Tax=Pseudoalteromonas luteoviolacea (strain 2ta16) TaxID=1353533 RepID=V4HTJ9_PSEL2|nr:MULTISPECIES: hypothetical protein [Pseudoalteromonas]ESP93113.1 hypothetical protein PL2TA16_03334 [Pseudoalteromonas luteoviolacea 2ta16]KZN36984.1 hypothetical protein N483_21300 [Pseudoalteromonas luteoviolacea NCIMB 1944]MCG7549913.1 hypothetical protein [Pseudoalteromonas sp. Of7M-16]